jgi:hypothetical protein
VRAGYLAARGPVLITEVIADAARVPLTGWVAWRSRLELSLSRDHTARTDDTPCFSVTVAG